MANDMGKEGVIEQISNVAREVLPSDARLFLFGSRARGTSRCNSDWDLLVLLNKERREPTDISRYACPFMELGYDIKEEINPIVYTSKEWESRRFTMFHHLVEKDQIELCH